jgi:hypothetical protein
LKRYVSQIDLIAGMFQRQRHNVAVLIDVEQGVIVKIHSLGDRAISESNV